MDARTTNYRTAQDASQDLPLFRITCDRPHPLYGQVFYTQDPGRALISGKCTDVGAIVVPQFHGLSARAPYFANGSAPTLIQLVDFYDKHLHLQYTAQQKQDLVNYLSTL